MTPGRAGRFAVCAVLTLSACGPQGDVPLPLAAPGPVEVVRNGASFAADLHPGPVLSVSRDPVFGHDEGKLAKDVAVQFCASRGGRLNPQAFGHYVGGQWVFKGGCV